MTLAGRVWNTLDADDRMLLLQHCNTISGETIKQHESTLSWDELLGCTQDDLLNVDFCGILGRDVQP